MGVFSIFPILVILVYLGIVVAILYLIYKWVNQFLDLKREHNDLLREISSKLDRKQ